MKKIISFILTCAMVLSLAACGSSEKTTITFWTTPVLPDEGRIEEIVAEFEEIHTDIDVELEYLTWEGVSEKLQIALSSGNTPDIYIDSAARTAALPALDILVPVDDIMNEFSDWNESILTFGMKDGKHYLVPASQIGTSTITVNVSLAKKLGVFDMLPEDRMSWDIHDFYNFVEAASKAGEAEGIKGIGLYAGSPTSDDVLYSLMMSNGGRILNEGKSSCIANSAECVEVVDLLGQMVKKGYAMEGATMLTGNDFAAPFTSQQIVVILTDPANLITLQFEQMQKDGYIDEVPEIWTYGIPTAKGSKMDSACWGANGIAIFDHQDEIKVEAAKTFARYLMDESSYCEDTWNHQPNYSPSRNNGIKFSNGSDAVKAETQFHQQITAAYADFGFGILDPYWPEVRNNFYPEMQSVYSGDKTAQEAMDSFVESVNKILAAQ